MDDILSEFRLATISVKSYLGSVEMSTEPNYYEKTKAISGTVDYLSFPPSYFCRSCGDNDSAGTYETRRHQHRVD